MIAIIISAEFIFVCAVHTITLNFAYIVIDTKHEPPDLLYLDPELLSTLNSPRTSIDSLDDSTTEAAAMMDDWQMHEVFQDISDILKVRIPSVRCEMFIHIASSTKNRNHDPPRRFKTP